MYGAGEFGLRHCFIPRPRKRISDLGNQFETREPRMQLYGRGRDGFGLLRVSHSAQTTSGVSIMSWITTSSIRIIPTSMTSRESRARDLGRIGGFSSRKTTARAKEELEIKKRSYWSVYRSRRGSFSLVCNMIGHHYGVNVR
jgi:hypothetical protein